MNVQFSERLTDLICEPIKVKLNGESYSVRFYDVIRRQLDSGDMETYIEREEFDCFCYNKNNKITYWPTRQGEQPLNERGKWKLEGHQEMKPGRFLSLLRPYFQVVYERSRVYEEDNPELFQAVFLRTCEVFTDKVRGMNAPLDFKISNKPSEIYAMPIHLAAGEYLHQSCMRNGSAHDCRQYAKFYDHVPGLKCVYQMAEGQLLMRALLWTKTRAGGSTGPVVSFLDRIYGSNAINHRLIEYAKTQKWAWRTFDDPEIHWEGDDGIVLYQPLGDRAVEYLHRRGAPYIDTLYLIPRNFHEPNPVLCVLTSLEGLDIRYWSVRDSSGDPFGWYSRCSICGERDHTDNMRKGTICKKCAKTHITQCPDCGKEIIKRQGLYSWKIGRKWYCTRCAHHRLNFTECQRCGMLVPGDKIRMLDGYRFCESCCTQKVKRCAVCGEDHYRGNMLVLPVRLRELATTSSVYVCSECASSRLVEVWDDDLVQDVYIERATEAPAVTITSAVEEEGGTR